MSRAIKFLLATVMAMTGFIAPAAANASGATIGGKVTASSGLSLTGTTVQLEKYDDDAETYTPIATATVTPSPSPSSSTAPYKFENVEDGNYRVNFPLTKSDVPTSKFGVSNSVNFAVTGGKIFVGSVTKLSIPDFKLNTMGKFSVKALDILTGNAIVNAKFSITGTFNGQDETFDSLTDPNADGTAILPIPVAGLYTLKIVDPSGMHQTSSIEKIFQSNLSATASYSLEAGGNLAVTVTTEQTKVAGAVVHLLSEDEEIASAIADSNGVATFYGLEPGTLSMWVGGPMGSPLKDSDAKDVTVVAGVTTPVSQALINGFTISGTLSSSDGPVAGARIEVAEVAADGAETPVSPAQTGQGGTFKTNGLAAGTYNLYFYDETSDLQDFRLPGQLLGVTVKAINGNVSNQQVLLPSAAVVAGTVTNSDAAPVAKTSVELIDVYGNSVTNSATDNQGKYRLPQIKPGIYTVKFTNDGYRTSYSDEFAAEGNKIADKSITLLSGSGISGKVLSTIKSQGIDGVRVSVYSSLGSGLSPVSTETTQPDGSYQISGLPAGSYRIKFDASDSTTPAGVFWQPASSAATNARSFGQAGDITTLPGFTVTNVNPVPVTPWVEVTGKVTETSENTPVENATVTVISTDGLVVQTGSTDTDGTFAVPVPDGQYGIKIAAVGYSTGYLGNVAGEPTLVAGFADAVLVTVAQGVANFDPKENLPSTWGDLSKWSIDLAGTGGIAKVTVVDETDSAVSEGVVVAYDRQGNQVAFADSCDDNGTFVISGLRGNLSFSYESAGTYAKRFVEGNAKSAGTTKLSDAGTKIGNFKSGVTNSYSLKAQVVPNLAVKLTVESGANAALYTENATIEVYTRQAGKWTLNADLSATTDDGTATIGVINGASYRIRVVPDSYLLAPVWVGAVPLANTVEDASVIVIPATGKAPTLDNVVLNVGTGAVKGLITDSFDNVLPNVQVQLVDSSGNIINSATSREDGVYNIYRATPGKYSLSFVAERYAIKYLNNVVVTASGTTVKDMTMDSATGVTGDFVSTDNQPVVGATVSIFGASGSGVTPIQKVTTSDDGTYNFIGLPAGSYKIRFDGATADVPTSAFWYSDSANVQTFKGAGLVTTTLGSYVKNINPKPTKPWALIKGTIVDSANSVSGAAVSLVTVSLATLTGEVVRTDVTDENGNFALYAPDGSYQIQVSASGFASGYIDAADNQSAILVTSPVGAAKVTVTDNAADIQGGLNPQDLTVDLSGSGGAATITVKDSAGKVVTDGEVTAYDSSGNIAGFASEAQSGVFTIAGLNGTYRFSFAQEGVFARTFFGDTSDIADPNTLTKVVNSSSKTSVTINVKVLPKLTVNIVDDSKPAVAFKQPVTVEVYSQVDGEWVLNAGLTQETSSGSVSFGVINGDKYRIRVVPNSELLTPVWVGGARLAKSVDLASTISIPETGAAPALGSVVMNSPAGVLEGIVSDSELVGIAGASVELIDNSGVVAGSTTTRADGGYHFGQILPGAYTAKFVGDGYSLKYLKVQILASQSATYDAILTPATGISGRVMLSGTPAAPIVGASVSVYSSRGSGLNAIQTVQTDADGNYNFIGLLPGSYKVYFDNSNATEPADSFWYGAVANVETFKQASVITASLGAYSSGIDPKPVTPWTLFTGNIHDGQWAVVGGSVELVSVSLISLSDSSTLSGLTDERGNFAIYAPDGSYRIKVAAPGYATGYVAANTGTAILGSSVANAAVLSVTDGSLAFDSGLAGTSLSLDLGVTGGKISVTVKDELGEGVTDGVVTVYDKTGKIVATDGASVAGVFTLAGLRGSYRVSFQLAGIFAETYFGDTNSTDLSSAKTIDINAGDNKAAAIKVKTLPKLNVNIYSTGTTAYKQPVVVEVYSLSDDEWKLNELLTQETSEGSVVLGVINSSQYRIRLVPANPVLAPVWLGGNATAQSVELAKSILIPEKGAIADVSGVVNGEAAAVTGLITGGDSSPLVGVSVELLATNGDLVAQTTTIEDGTYTFNQIIPGTYSIKFATEGYASKRVRSVVLTAGQVTTQNATLESASGISGRVLATGQETPELILGRSQLNVGDSSPADVPLVGATVGLYASSGSGLTPIRTEVTDENGNYNFAGLTPGSYRIRIDGTTAVIPAERVWYLSGEANATKFADAGTVVAVRGELSRDVDPAVLKSWTALTGLLKSGNYSLSGATVTLVPLDNGGAIAGETDADGFIRVYAPDGDYRVRIDVAGYPSGYITKTDDGVILAPLSSKTTVLRVAQGRATFDDGVDLMSNPLDLSTSGGTLSVSVTMGSIKFTSGVAKVYNRAGAVVAYSDTAKNNAFNFEGLPVGEYRVSFQRTNSPNELFLGGTSVLEDPKTSYVKVQNQKISYAQIDVYQTPRIFVKICDLSNALNCGFTSLAFNQVNVYEQVGDKWILQPSLSGQAQHSWQFEALSTASYRIQVVPENPNIAATWVGSPTAANIDGATSFTGPVSKDATLPEVRLSAAVQVSVPVKNELAEPLENVRVHLDVKQVTGSAEMDSKYIGTLEAGETQYVTFNNVPTSMFPIRVTGTSTNSDEVFWESTGSASGTVVTSDTLSFSKVGVPASASGYIKTVSGNAVPNQDVTLLTDEGDEYATTLTNENGEYTFSGLPLGVHFTVASDSDTGFLVADGDTDFTGRSGTNYEVNFIQHFSATFGGVVLDSEGNPRANALVNVYHLSGAQLDILTDDSFSVYSDAEGKWTFDGAEFGLEVGNYAFFTDGLDSDFTPAYLASLDCSPEKLTVCATNKPAEAAVVVTNEITQSITDLTLVLGAPDKVAPSGVKFKTSPAATTAVMPFWQWTGADTVDGSALRSEVVVASAAYGGAMSTWSDPIDIAGSSYSVSGTKGSTYCISVRMVDKSGNASAFTAPSCTTMLMDDTALKPVKPALWSQVVVKKAYLGKAISVKKKSKSAVLKIAKSANGTGLCIYYVTGAKFGTFTVSINGKKLGKPVKTAGKAGVIKSICFVTKVKANSKIAITVPKAGNGVQIDGYAITVAKPAAPVPPRATLKSH